MSVHGKNTEARVSEEQKDGEINFSILPLVGFGLGRIFFSDRPSLALGLLMIALIPTSSMTVTWTGFARGNVDVAVKMMIFGLITGSVLAPFYIRFLLGAQVIVERPLLLFQILVPVFIFYFVIVAAGILAGRFLLPRADAVALIYGTILRNLSISLAIAVNAFGKAGTGAALVLAAAFIVQTQVATWSTRFVDRLFP